MNLHHKAKTEYINWTKTNDDEHKSYGFTHGDLERLGGKADRPLDTELLVFSPVDEVGGDCNAVDVSFGGITTVDDTYTFRGS